MTGPMAADAAPRMNPHEDTTSMDVIASVWGQVLPPSPPPAPARPKPESTLVNRNVVVEAGRTSLRLEPEFWEALAEEAEARGVGVSDVVRAIEHEARAAGHRGGRTSRVRTWTLRRAQERAHAAEDALRAAVGQRVADAVRHGAGAGR